MHHCIGSLLNIHSATSFSFWHFENLIVRPHLGVQHICVPVVLPLIIPAQPLPIWDLMVMNGLHSLYVCSTPHCVSSLVVIVRTATRSHCCNQVLSYLVCFIYDHPYALEVGSSHEIHRLINGPELSYIDLYVNSQIDSHSS